MRHFLSAVFVVAALALLGGSLASAQSPATPKNVPSGYVNVHTLVQLPEFIPGMGALYVNPKNVPTGPWIAYGKNGNPIDVMFMIPISKMDAHQNWDNLPGVGDLLKELGVTVNHVDIMYNPGHPGLPVPHYHFMLVFVSHSAEQAATTLNSSGASGGNSGGNSMSGGMNMSGGMGGNSGY
jgi:hypothetical protein